MNSHNNPGLLKIGALLIVAATATSTAWAQSYGPSWPGKTVASLSIAGDYSPDFTLVAQLDGRGGKELIFGNREEDAAGRVSDNAQIVLTAYSYDKGKFRQIGKGRLPLRIQSTSCGPSMAMCGCGGALAFADSKPYRRRY